MTNAADPKAIAKNEKRQKHQAELLENAWKWLLAEDRGRRIAWSLLEQTHVFRTSMTGNSQTFFLEGERNIGLKLLDTIMATNPQAFAQMQAEAKAETPDEPDPESED